MDELTEKRLAHNQAVFRDANERILDAANEIGADPHRLPFICECADTACTTVLLLEAADYGAVRRNPRRFLHAPGHDDDLGTVVEAHADYVVVEKDGVAAGVAERHAER